MRKRRARSTGSRCASTGPDPRVALRETPPDDALFARLDRMGPWTYEYLQLIAERPAVRAGDLAESFGRERLASSATSASSRSSA